MKLTFTILIWFTLQACNSDHYSNNDAQNGSIAISANHILSSFTSWYNYTYKNVRLSQDFIGLDLDSSEMDKTRFLEKLMTGRVVALKTSIINKKPVYKLYSYTGTDTNILSTAQQLASIEMKNYRMEGNQLPDFYFVDLNGKKYTPASIKGKTLVLKCWFIHCVSCVNEFPACNELVDKYKNENDILFVSLATDKKDQLRQFLTTKVFKYQVVPEMDDYMVNTLHIDMYPTHILVDASGKIVKVTNSIEELKPFVEKQVAIPNR